jgi:hypothetical protein
MSSKGEIVRKLSLRRCILAIIIVCASAQWAASDALTQKAAAPLKMTERSTFWLLEGPGPSTVPHLASGIADRGDTASYGPLRLARDESANPLTQERSSAARIKSDVINTTDRQAAVVILLIAASHFPHGD